MNGSCLSSAIVSKQRDDFVLLDTHGQLIDGAEIAKLFRQQLQLDGIVGVECLQSLTLTALHCGSTSFLGPLEQLLGELIVLECVCVSILSVAKLSRLDSAAPGNSFICCPGEEGRVEILIVLIISDSLLALEAVAAGLGNTILVRGDRLDVNLEIVVEHRSDDKEDPCGSGSLLEE